MTIISPRDHFAIEERRSHRAHEASGRVHESTVGIGYRLLSDRLADAIR